MRWRDCKSWYLLGRQALCPGLEPQPAPSGLQPHRPLLPPHRAALGKEDHGGPQARGAREETW